MNPFKFVSLTQMYMNQHELEAARNARIREIRIWQAIREISIYAVFLTILFYITFTNIGNSAYDYQNSMKQMFVMNEVSPFYFQFLLCCSIYMKSFISIKDVFS